MRNLLKIEMVSNESIAVINEANEQVFINGGCTYSFLQDSTEMHALVFQWLLWRQDENQENVQVETLAQIFEFNH